MNLGALESFPTQAQGCETRGLPFTAMVRRALHDNLYKASAFGARFVTSEQAAALAIYLCSYAAAQITGANLSRNGGWTA